MDRLNWKTPELFAGDTTALEAAGYTKLLSAVLFSRGLDTPEKAALYLLQDRSELSSPLTLKDMDKAVTRLEEAIAAQESVAVYGDYDVDGITASCLLADYLRSRGLNCLIYIPDRIDEGYGLNRQALEALRERGVSLVVTVDCGITAFADAEFAKSINLDIIITDHHECPAQLPVCSAVVNPKRQGAGYPAYELAGVGVALKLVCALDGDSERTFEEYCDLAALGTIADVMPLTGENRILVRRGLEKLQSEPRPGISALLAECGAAEKPMTATLVSYSLAPRINAAGRLGETPTALELLLCKDSARAECLAKSLCDLNRRRQALEAHVVADAAAKLGSGKRNSPVVLAGEDWHPGVVGIAASRISESYHVPAIIICLDGERGKGSCRSFGSFNIFDALAACGEYLESFGGHAFAAGLNIKREQIDGFRQALASYYNGREPEEGGGLSPEVNLPGFFPLTMRGVQSLETLEPCGAGNPRPLLCVCGAVLDSITELAGGKHLRLSFTKDAQSIEGVFFGQTLEALPIRTGDIADICFTPQVNEFRGKRSVQLLVAGVRASEEERLCWELLSETGEQLAEISGRTLTREGLGRLWRGLKHSKGYMSLPALFRDGGLSAAPIEACLGIRVFEELGLLSYSLDRSEGVVDFKIAPGRLKTQLESSPLFRILSETHAQE
ncbi:MAG: single-stranded-DNA-specific exonuclease RecJ [Oscillospiraceae bacterium]|jgi:single-stranded-DNA-specific exonuclease|nr:single-stranded-DNA-specific exonuclease RecJ [Oscillospiraceae bacterium]